MDLANHLDPEQLKKLEQISKKMPDAQQELRQRQIRNIVNRNVEQLKKLNIILVHERRNRYVVPEIKMTVKLWVQPDNSITYAIGSQIFTFDQFLVFISNNNHKKA